MCGDTLSNQLTSHPPPAQGTGPKGDLGEALRRIDAVLDDKGLSLLRARLPRAYAEHCQGERLLLQAARECVMGCCMCFLGGFV